jgi:hypothetical protein
MALMSDFVNNDRFAVCRITDDDDRFLALKSLPKSVSAMILHTKCRLGREVVIETTLIRHKCVDLEFSKVLFKVEAINGWLTGSKQKPVVNLIPIDGFHSGTAQQQLSQNLPPMRYSQHQLSQQQMSQQFAQLSQPPIPNMAMAHHHQHAALRFARLSQNSIQLPMSQPAAMSQLSQQMRSFGNQSSYSQLPVDDKFQLQGKMGYGIP